MPTPSPQKTRRQGIRPHAEIDATTGKVFPASDDESPLAELREKIIVSDQEKLVRFRQVSGSATESGRGSEVVETLKESTAPLLIQHAYAHTHPDRPTPRAATPTETHQAQCSNEIKSAPKVSKRASQCTITSRPASRTKSLEALAMDNRLDKMASWIKNVETIIEDARKAVAEGREPGLPILSLPAELTVADPSTNNNVSQVTVVHRFGVTPDKATAIPSHLRTSSVQVEPATPPKWMTYAEAEEKIQAANARLEEQQQGRRKKERPTVGHVLKLFGGEKEKVVSRSSTCKSSFHFENVFVADDNHVSSFVLLFYSRFKPSLRTAQAPSANSSWRPFFSRSS